jgi:hypothetical protein
MLKILPREPIPEWLVSYKPGDKIPFSSLINNSVYYPACGFDGDIANLCMGYSHQFIYVDNLCLWANTTKETIYESLSNPENFKGFQRIFQRLYQWQQRYSKFFGKF